MVQLVGHLMRFVGLDHKTPIESLANGPGRSSKSFRKRLEKVFIEKYTEHNKWTKEIIKIGALRKY